jgi:trk/ktr system potassium uptake protein
MRSVLSIVGMLLGGLSAAMFIPALFDPRDADPFLLAAALTAFAAGGLYLSCRGRGYEIRRREAYLLTSGAWIALSVFAALPFVFSGLGVTDAVFESVSGLTTTGSTVLSGLDDLSPALLLWRALLQWAGGIGIIVTSIAILPLLRVGGMQLFRTESSDQSEKEMPRATMVAGTTLWVYAGLSVACAAAYWAAGMSGFDAVTHAMTTVSTGGYSTHDSSMGFFNSPLIYWIGAVFMLAGGLPFVLYMRVVRKGSFASVQARSLLIFLLVVIAVLTIWRLSSAEIPLFEALTQVTFHVVSIVTTTGYATEDYTTWGAFAVVLFFFLTFSGGCTGSTSGGLKIMRFIVLFKMIRIQFRSIVFPHGVFAVKYENELLKNDVKESVGVFIFMFLSSVFVLALLLQIDGLDFATSVSGAVTAIANVGPGIGSTIGPAGNFATLPDVAKWLLAIGMLFGRLEFLTLLVLLTPTYWRG